MCNCGNKRAQLNQQNAATPLKSKTQSMHKATNNVFEYTGKTALTVVGKITGRTYRFNHNGDVQIIDQRDVSTISTIAVLKRR